ncbi:hypothetical protein BFJ70_g17132 [Fusarium oxysporum]|nr:hypothetical protein BFJ70_g17132 [Fusarium oxysporum]
MRPRLSMHLLCLFILAYLPKHKCQVVHAANTSQYLCRACPSCRSQFHIANRTSRCMSRDLPSSRRVMNPYASSVPTASSVSISSLAGGNKDIGISLFAGKHMNSRYSPARGLSLEICLNEMSHVVATGFFCRIDHGPQTLGSVASPTSHRSTHSALGIESSRSPS